MSKKQDPSIGLLIPIAIAIGAVVMGIEWLAQSPAALIGLGGVIIIGITIIAYFKQTGKVSGTDTQDKPEQT